MRGRFGAGRTLLATGLAVIGVASQLSADPGPGIAAANAEYVDGSDGHPWPGPGRTYGE